MDTVVIIIPTYNDATIEMDADFQHDPKYVKDLVDAYMGGADYVIGSRYIKGGSIPAGWEFYRKAISFFGNFIARVILLLPKIHDLTTGFRLTRVKGVLDQIDLENLMELRRFAFKLDLLYKSIKLSKKTVEVPIAFAERTQETSKFNPKEITASYKVLFLLRYHESKRFLKIVSSIICLWYFYLFIRQYVGREALWFTFVFALFPARWLIVRSVGSPEPLFVGAIIASLYYFQNKKYWWAGNVAK